MCVYVLSNVGMSVGCAAKVLSLMAAHASFHWAWAWALLNP